MLAASMGYSDTCTILLREGADPGLKDSQGETASSRAYNSGHYDLAERLLASETQ